MPVIIRLGLSVLVLVATFFLLRTLPALFITAPRRVASDATS